jgi:hypothetical protein
MCTDLANPTHVTWRFIASEAEAETVQALPRTMQATKMVQNIANNNMMQAANA